jgi:hypothetical protein
MSKNISIRQPLPLIKNALSTLCSHPEILFPFLLYAFIELLVFEIIYFSPRYPLSSFFGPIITRMEGEVFLHYPYNFILLTKWFQKAQIPLYILFYGFFLSAAIKVIDTINQNKTIVFRTIFTKAFTAYVHVFCAIFLIVLIKIGITSLYALVIKRALIIRSTSGIFYLIKRLVIEGTPYYNLIFTALSMTILAYMIPIILVEGKKVWAAFLLNFKYLWKSFWCTFFIMFLPTLLYSPVILLKANGKIFETIGIPELWGLTLVIGLLISIFIGALQFTATTMLYLLKKGEES